MGIVGYCRHSLFEVEKQPRLAQGCVDAVCHCQSPVKRLSPCPKEWPRYGVWSIMGPRHVAWNAPAARHFNLCSLLHSDVQHGITW